MRTFYLSAPTRPPAPIPPSSDLSRTLPSPLPRSQNLINPPGRGKPELPRGAYKPLFRLSDRVIQRTNNYEKDVFNGMIASGPIAHPPHASFRPDGHALSYLTGNARGLKASERNGSVRPLVPAGDALRHQTGAECAGAAQSLLAPPRRTPPLEHSLPGLLDVSPPCA